MPFAEIIAAPTTAMLLWCVLTVAWLALAALLLRSDAERRARITQRVMVALVPLLMACAIPTGVFSDDVHRYRWDGWVMANGMDPYHFAPADTALRALHRSTPDGERYPDVVPYDHLHTIYPPGVQLIVGGITSVTGLSTGIVFKLCWWSVVVLLTIVLIRLVPHDLRHWLAIALTCPTTLLHGYVDVHADVVMALLCAIGLVLAHRGSPLRGASAVAAAITMKYLPLFFVPALMMNRTRQQRAIMLAVMAAVTAAIVTPFVSGNMFGSLTTFLRSWQANAGVYALLRVALSDVHTRIVLTALVVGALGIVWHRHRTTPVVAGVLSTLVLLVFAPVVHAWYLLLPLLLLPHAPLRSTLVWGATMCVYGITVATYKGNGVWFDHPVALAVEFVPVLTALAVDVWRGPLALRYEQGAHRT